MDAFLDRFYRLVDRNLGDPFTQKRLTKADRLQDLYSVERIIWEELLRLCGQQSVIGRTEAVITVVDGEAFYPLPGNFRQYISFELRVNDSRDDVSARYGSIAFNQTGPGIEIINNQQGMMLRPTPSATEAGDWVLTYMKGPVMLHHGTCRDDQVGPRSIQLSGPANGDAGEWVKTPNYYAGSLVSVYSADVGQGQTAEIVANDSTVTCALRHPWVPKPRGNVKYEIRPLLPPFLDELYALDVAIKNMPRRHRGQDVPDAENQRVRLWNACKRQFLSTVADRAPERLIPTSHMELDPYSVF